MTKTFRIRCVLGGTAFAALLLASFRISGGQSAVSLSRPGQDDLTFWANHNGLAELDVQGEVGFGDMARILNAATRQFRSNARPARPLYVQGPRDGGARYTGP